MTSDFNFLFGRWAVSHRRLKQRHVGSDDWIHFDGVVVCEPRLDGVINVEEHRQEGKPFGFALRTFDLKTRRWSIYWVNPADGLLQAPVHGGFQRGVGVFEGEDVDDGRPIRARYVWSGITADSARWEQAFSLDGGRTWETNWVMDFVRSEAV
ncbi:hypothetical protein [Cystobacter ferrugineus]|uniref:DUF1579 domain-containing protein n=1 Tax=Cystobacter ferrugineus TaxID=83449 RepID=A0A1L9B5I0_9BACT|nr:hypothetical protein [Cystobacter ferrugineus]OJH37470.1 hypothetical protein BON30_29785 [Cystobacter ferrugineus]